MIDLVVRVVAALVMAAIPAIAAGVAVAQLRKRKQQHPTDAVGPGFPILGAPVVVYMPSAVGYVVRDRG